MPSERTENIVGALILALSDAVLHDTENQAPEPGQAAAAIALLRHEPGMQIELLRRALRLSHPGTVRLVDRLVADGMVERRPSSHDRRAVALHLTEAGERSCTGILAARLDRIRQALAAFDASERKIFVRLTEKLLVGFIRDVDHAYSVCRLCDAQACTECPVTCALNARA